MKRQIWMKIMVIIMAISMFTGCGKTAIGEMSELETGKHQDSDEEKTELDTGKADKNETNEKNSESESSDKGAPSELPSETTQKETENAGAEEQDKDLPDSENKPTNQLTSEMDEDVEVFKVSSEGHQRLMTLNTTVGGKVSITTPWQDYRLYSQNTDIACIEGKLIRGVTEGTTYVVIEAGGIREVYRVNVGPSTGEENHAPDNGQVGENQLTSEMNEDVEVFKATSDGHQRLMTLNTTVGGKVSITTPWQGYKLYSQDTGVARIEGKLICGASKGTTYVVIEVGGIREVYRIIVS